MLDCIHIYVFPSWKTVFKQSQQLLDTSLILGYLSSFLTSSYRNLDSFSTARWINRDFFWILNSFSIAGWSIEGGFCVIVSQYLSIHWDFFFLHALFFTCFASFFYLVIHSNLFHYINSFLWILCASLIIFDHLYISRVKRSSFLYPLSIMTEMGRNCGNMWFLFKDSIF